MATSIDSPRRAMTRSGPQTWGRTTIRTIITVSAKDVLGTALAGKYGPGKIVVLHVDAHHDTYLSDMGRMVYLSFDVDGISPAYAPGATTQDPDGMTASPALQLVRAVAIGSDLVAADSIEYSPLLDDNHMTTGILIDRLIRSLLAGIAAKRKGITDPLYIDPRRLRYDA